MSYTIRCQPKRQSSEGLVGAGESTFEVAHFQGQQVALAVGALSSFQCGLPYSSARVFAQPSAGNLQSIISEGTSPRDLKGRSCSAINSWLQKAQAVAPAVLTRSHRSALFYVGVRGHEYQGVRIIGGQCGVQLSKLLTQWVIIAHSMSL